MTQEIEKLEPSNPTLALVLANRKDEILKMGGFTEKEVARFIATALSSVSTNEKLKQCSMESVVMAPPKHTLPNTPSQKHSKHYITYTHAHTSDGLWMYLPY